MRWSSRTPPVDAATSYDQTLDDVEEYLTKPSRKAVTSC